MKCEHKELELNDNGSKIKIYEVSYDLEEDLELLNKVEEFTKLTKDTTYKRSKMGDLGHAKNILIGKLAEEAFAKLLDEFFNLKLNVNYDNKIDEGDFILNGLKVDIKSSSLKTKRKTYKLEEALLKFNFMVLRDQSRKDIIVQALYPSREEYYKFYFSKWAYVKDVVKYSNYKTIYIKMNGGTGEYYLMPLMEGKDLENLVIEIKKNIR